jgi:DNA-directed RNA polymerase subunit M/transcription elongation factor TFIIS
MNFCSTCDNMLYIKLSEDENSLINYCRNCGNEDSTNNENKCIFKQNFKRNDLVYSDSINEYTKLDPTLPRINNIKCPNSECPSNTSSKEKEIISVRYDDVRIKYIYLCCNCDHVWKIDKTS